MDNKHTIDASGKILGRLASEIAILLRGKNKPNYQPYLQEGEEVVVFNTDKIKVTGKKMEKKMYFSHSGYMGGLRTRTLEDLFKNDSREALAEAVYGMLPKNKLRAKMMRKLIMHQGEIKNK